MPALAIVIYSGLEQRQRSIENAQQEVLLLTSGKPLTLSNLGDRKHVRGAIERNEFSIGEYIISRIGSATPAFAFAYPVLDKNNRLKAVLTTATKLTHFSDFHDFSNLPERSFIAVTDHKGVRLFYYPPKEDTNPVGKPIIKQSWEKASKAKEPGIFIGRGSDGIRRIFAFEQVRFMPDDTPYIYVWTGTPEAYALAPANATLTGNLLLLIMATVLSLFISWLIGKKTLLSPIQNLVDLTRKFAQGDLGARSELKAKPDEFHTLTKAFHDMADTLVINQRTLRESEDRFKTLFEYAPEAYYLNNFEGCFIDSNRKAEELLGYKREELIGKNFFELDLLSGKELQRATKLLSENMNGKATGPDEFTLKRKNGRQFIVEISTIPTIIGGQDIVVGVARDITERKRSAEALRESEEKLARSKKMEFLGLLAGGVAHDLNNVLSGILNYPELILMDLPEDSKFRKPIETIKESGQRALEIVQDLLTVARGVAITRQPLNIKSLILLRVPI
jgi:PAS domain S-box-containing protein